MTEKEKREKLADLESQIKFLSEKYVDAPTFIAKVHIEMHLNTVKQMYLVIKASETFEEDLNALVEKRLNGQS